MNPLSLAQALIRCPSITPQDAGAIGVLEEALKPMGFVCHRLKFGEVENLYARLGTDGPNFCFAGHTDVVPPGNIDAWKVNPFAGEVIDGALYGRGAVDMKGAVAAFIAAISGFRFQASGFRGSISLLITGDEEGDAKDGTVRVLEWLKSKDETIDACLVGEPTCVNHVGDTIKIGRRGSITFTLTVHGTQGHVAYPHLADNPVTALVSILHELKRRPLDKGAKFFQASNLEVTTIDVGNKAANVIPASACAVFNVRFNDKHRAASLEQWVRDICDKTGKRYALEAHITGEAFLTKPGVLSDLVVSAVKEVTGKAPEISTSGGTSDARFIKDFCPVIELGLTNATAHKVDEHVPVKDLETLTAIYRKVLECF